jgi:transglutaminase-like putative cysteine protease
VSDRGATDLGRDIAATLALAGYSAAIAIGFARVFSGWEFLTDLLVLVIVGHGASFVLRRAGLSGWISIPGVAVLLVWTLLILHYRDTLTVLLPTGTTWDQLDLEVGLVRQQFPTAIAPVIYGAGWASVAGFAMLVAIVMSDSFAFRAEARGEALVPGGVLFIFIAAIAADRLRIASTALLIATGVLAVVALRALHDRSRRVELAPRGRSTSAIVPASLVAAVVLAVLAGFVGPRIPGASAEPLYNTKTGDGVTEVISPLVDIRSRLTNRSEVELFRVFAEAPAYWRATALSEFDGRTFKLPNSDLTRLDTASSVLGVRVVQQIQVLDLRGRLLPAAADPIQGGGVQSGEAVGLEIERDSSSLLAPEAFENGDEFTVVSQVATPTAEQLRAATSVAPPDEIFLELPDMPSVVAERAAEVTAGASTSYDRARALQDWFRDEFDYSLEVQSGHGSSAIESFLNEQIGYCEQFSATFAAMARTLGIPSRVAVGYTQGIQSSEGWYRVLGRNAHAWPEVWFDGIGWVPFEPTPGRGAPGAEDYTGVPPAQDDAPITGPDDGGAVATNPTTPTTVVPAPTTTLAPGETVPTTDPLDGEIPEVTVAPGAVPPLEGTGGAGDEGGFSIPWGTLITLLLLATVVLAPWILRRIRTARQRREPPAERVRAAWSRALTAVEAAGVAGRDSMTASEWAAATSARLPVAARPMASLARVVDQISFGPPGTVDLEREGMLGWTLGRDCELWSAQVSDIAQDEMSVVQRIKRYFAV